MNQFHALIAGRLVDSPRYFGGEAVAFRRLELNWVVLHVGLVSQARRTAGDSVPSVGLPV